MARGDLVGRDLGAFHLTAYLGGDGMGTVALRDMAVVHVGLAQADAVWVSAGALAIESCRLADGAMSADGRHGGAGLRATGQTSATVTRTEIVGNGSCGVYARDDATVSLDEILSEKNSGSGMRLDGRVRGSVRNSTCRSNGKPGIYIDDQAAPELLGNQCHENQLGGIAYFGDARGTARDNTCRANVKNGIYVDQRAAPDLVANRCSGNKNGDVRDNRA